MLRYLVIDTSNWLPAKKVILPPNWTTRIDWSVRQMGVDLTRAQLKACPEYDPTEPVNREYEIQLYDYYGRPKYWR